MSRRTDKGPSIVVRCPRLQVHHTPAMKPGIQRKRARPQQGKGDEHTQVYNPDLRWWQPQHRKESKPARNKRGNSGDQANQQCECGQACKDAHQQCGRT